MVGIGCGNLQRECLALLSGMACDGEHPLRGIVHKTVVSGDVLRKIHLAGEILAAGIFGERDLVRLEHQRAAFDRGGVLRPGHIQQVQGITEQRLIAGFSANPIAVDIQIEVLGHTVAAVFRQPEADGVRRSIACFLIREAHGRGGIAVVQNSLQAGQDTGIVDLLAVDGVVACVVRVILGGLQAVGDLTGSGDPVGGGLKVRPGTGAGIGLKIRGHGRGADERRVRKDRR